MTSECRHLGACLPWSQFGESYHRQRKHQWPVYLSVTVRFVMAHGDFANSVLEGKFRLVSEFRERRELTTCQDDAILICRATVGGRVLEVEREGRQTMADITIDRIEKKYKADEYFLGKKPSSMCYEVLKLKPPTRRLKVLDIGCGEGNDAVFFARNGYDVTGIEISDAGLNKAKRLAITDNSNISDPSTYG